MRYLLLLSMVFFVACADQSTPNPMASAPTYSSQEFSADFLQIAVGGNAGVDGIYAEATDSEAATPAYRINAKDFRSLAKKRKSYYTKDRYEQDIHEKIDGINAYLNKYNRPFRLRDEKTGDIQPMTLKPEIASDLQAQLKAWQNALNESVSKD